MHVTADRDRCVGAGQCALSAPNVFDQDEEDGLVTVLDADPGEDESDAVVRAVHDCPSSAIRVTMERAVG